MHVATCSHKGLGTVLMADAWHAVNLNSRVRAYLPV